MTEKTAVRNAKSKLLLDVQGLCERLLPDGHREGSEWIACNPRRTDHNPGSFKVNLRTGKWSDFAIQESGDVLDLYCYVRALTVTEALRELDEIPDVPMSERKPTAGKDDWVPVIPAPREARVDEISHPKRGKPAREWAYRDSEGRLMGYVCRFEGPDGSKDLLPLTYCRAGNRAAWRWKGFPKPRPLFGLDRLAANPEAPVLVVEGEKCAEAAQAALPDFVVLTWAGGCQGVRFADWRWLKGRTVTVWPDADAPGRSAAEAIADALRGSPVEILNTPAGVSQGWDVADAIAEGWDSERLRAWILAGGDSRQPEVLTEPEPDPELAPTTLEEPWRAIVPLSEDVKVSDSILADHILAFLRGSFVFDTTKRTWFFCRNGVWEDLSEERAGRMAAYCMSRALPTGYNTNQRDRVFRLIREQLAIEASTWNSRRDLLPMKSGVLNLNTLKVAPHNPAHRFNWTLPYDFDAGATMDASLRFLERITAGKQGRLYALRAFMACLIRGETKFQRYLELIGAGGGGKSTLIGLLRGLVGEHNAVESSLPVLARSQFEASRLYGKRLCCITEADVHNGDMSTLKAITGGDSLRFELKHERIIRSFVFEGLVVIAANAPIPCSDAGAAIFRRKIPIPVESAVPASERDERLAEKLAAELPAVMRWALEMPADEVAEVMRGKGVLAESLGALIADNSVAAWANEHLKASPNGFVPIGPARRDAYEVYGTADNAYASYVAWCIQTDERRAVPHKFFPDRLVQVLKLAGVHVERARTSRARGLRGVELVQGLPERGVLEL